jgi:hypothetical protein
MTSSRCIDRPWIFCAFKKKKKRVKTGSLHFMTSCKYNSLYGVSPVFSWVLPPLLPRREREGEGKKDRGRRREPHLTTMSLQTSH